MLKRALRALERALGAADAVILSDYNQDLLDEGVVRHAVSLCRRSRVPVIADSRFRLSLYRGVTSATPNEVEASQAAGVPLSDGPALEGIGRRLLKSLSASSVLVTRGRFGMSLFEKRRRTRSVGVLGSSEATDVTGAGDTVVSAVALTLAASGSMTEAMMLANAAAARVVMKRGTAVTSVPEILGLLDESECIDGSVGS